MALTANLCSVRVSTDSEHEDWNLHQILIDTAGEKIEWISQNHPELSIMRRLTYDPLSDQILYTWYVDFPDIERLTHYKLIFE